MKALLIGLLFAASAFNAYPQSDFQQARGQAQWAIRYIGTSKNAAQKERYMRDINSYAALLQKYIGEKPTPCTGDPQAFISNLEKLAAAKSREQHQQAARDAEPYPRDASQDEHQLAEMERRQRALEERQRQFEYQQKLEEIRKRNAPRAR